MPWSERVQTIVLLQKNLTSSSKKKSEKHFARNAENWVLRTLIQNANILLAMEELPTIWVAEGREKYLSRCNVKLYKKMLYINIIQN